MVQGFSARKASVYTQEQGNRVPFNTLSDLYLKCFGVSANSRKTIKPAQQKKMIQRILEYELPASGPAAYFLKDEEEIIMRTLEFAYERGFPYDEDNLIALATTMLRVKQCECLGHDNSELISDLYLILFDCL